MCEFWGYHKKAIEDSILLGCDAASLREVVPQKGTWAMKNVVQRDIPEDQILNQLRDVQRVTEKRRRKPVCSYAVYGFTSADRNCLPISRSKVNLISRKI